MLNLNDIQSNTRKIKTSRRNLIIFILVILAIITIVFYQRLTTQGTVIENNNSSDIRQVIVASVSDLSLNLDPLPLLGEVQSQSSATVYSQSSGEVIGVYKKSGDYVYNNQIIAEVDNLTQRSVVAQATAGVELAQANLDKIKKGGTDTQTSILKTALESAQTNLDQTRISVVNTLNDAFAKTDDAIRNKVDTMFSNPRGDSPQVLFSVADSQLEIDIEWGRYLAEGMLDKWEASLGDVSVESDLVAELDKRKIDLDSVRVFLDKLAMAVNVLSPNSNLSETTINTWKATLSATRTVVNGTITSLSGAKSSLNGATSGVEVAQLNYEQALSGGRSEDIIAAESQLKQAQAGLQSANASLEKTIVRATISGTINSLDLEQGDFISAFTPVATIANNNSLEVITYITEENRKDVKVGSKVSVGSDWQGVVKKIAPSLDPQTKKIKVEISVNGSAVSLTNGQSVSLLLQRTPSKNQTVTDFSVPISAIKIGADQTVVFTVDADNKLVAHPVTLGPIQGGKILLSEGVTADMEIVTDARGLQEGQEISIK